MTMVMSLNYQSNGGWETFQKHVERMKMFRRSHGPVQHTQSTGTFRGAGARVGREELSRGLLILLSLGYVLELIRGNGAVLLSRYSRN